MEETDLSEFSRVNRYLFLVLRESFRLFMLEKELNLKMVSGMMLAMILPS